MARVHDVASGTTRTLPSAVYALSPDGSFAVTTDFRRINEFRPGYGYAGLADPWTGEAARTDEVRRPCHGLPGLDGPRVGTAVRPRGSRWSTPARPASPHR
ncbi:MAG: hypothetical protein ISQ70_08380 [Pirellulales bacterium]|nr:hypothetical protein [Pirellulales bacterium]